MMVVVLLVVSVVVLFPAAPVLLIRSLRVKRCWKAGRYRLSDWQRHYIYTPLVLNERVPDTWILPAAPVVIPSTEPMTRLDPAVHCEITGTRYHKVCALNKEDVSRAKCRRRWH